MRYRMFIEVNTKPLDPGTEPRKMMINIKHLSYYSDNNVQLYDYHYRVMETAMQISDRIDALYAQDCYYNEAAPR